MSRLEYLAVAAYNLLVRQQNSPIVLDLTNEEVKYDGAECDGYCLIDDMKLELENILGNLETDEEIDIDTKVVYADGEYHTV